MRDHDEGPTEDDTTSRDTWREVTPAEAVTAAALLALSGVGAWMLWSDGIREMPRRVIDAVGNLFG